MAELVVVDVDLDAEVTAVIIARQHHQFAILAYANVFKAELLDVALKTPALEVSDQHAGLKYRQFGQEIYVEVIAVFMA